MCFAARSPAAPFSITSKKSGSIRLFCSVPGCCPAHMGDIMKGIAVAAMIALAAGNAACTTTGKRVGGAAVGGVFGAAVAGPVGAAAGAAAGAATAPTFVR